MCLQLIEIFNFKRTTKKVYVGGYFRQYLFLDCYIWRPYLLPAEK